MRDQGDVSRPEPGRLGRNYSQPMISSEMLELSAAGQRCLALAQLRLMDIDISATPSKQQAQKLKDREKYVELLGAIVPVPARTYSSQLTGPTGNLLRDACHDFSNTSQQCQVMAEISLCDPWNGKSAVFRHHIDDHIRRLVLKEIAANFNWPSPESKVNDALDVELPNVKGATMDYAKIFKISAAVAGGAIIGGLVLAPHIGAAIGAGMGLSGAAATSAGLAALGFGSLASGGLGMAGGMLVVGATSGVIGGGLTSIAMIASNVRLDVATEIQKLRVALFLMLSMEPSTQDALEYIKSIKDNVASLREIIASEKAKETPDKKLIKDTEKEIRLLLASIPTGR